MQLIVIDIPGATHMKSPSSGLRDNEYHIINRHYDNIRWKALCSMQWSSRKASVRLRIDYVPETIDLHEKLFEDKLKLKPESGKVTINAIYRVKDLSSKDEHYFYPATKTCLNALNQLAKPFSYERYGYHRVPMVELIYSRGSLFSAGSL